MLAQLDLLRRIEIITPPYSHRFGGLSLHGLLGLAGNHASGLEPGTVGCVRVLSREQLRTVTPALARYAIGEKQPSNVAGPAPRTLLHWVFWFEPGRRRHCGSTPARVLGGAWPGVRTPFPPLSVSRPAATADAPSPLRLWMLTDRGSPRGNTYLRTE